MCDGNLPNEKIPKEGHEVYKGCFGCTLVHQPGINKNLQQYRMPNTNQHLDHRKFLGDPFKAQTSKTEL